MKLMMYSGAAGVVVVVDVVVDALELLAGYELS